MSIINRQIGWSNESNLLWYILKEMDRLVKVTSKSCACSTGSRPCYVEILFDGVSPITDLTTANSYFATIDGTSQLFTGFVPIPSGCRLYGGKNLQIINNAFDTTTITSFDDPCSVITALGTQSFYTSSLYYVNLPGITIIDNNATFASCVNLQVVNLPNLVEISANETFKTCTVLSTITLPKLVSITGNINFADSGIDSLSSFPILTTITGNSNFNNITGTNIPDTVFPKLTTITGNQTFENFDTVSITLPALETITGSQTFKKSYSLTTIILPKLESVIGSNNFDQVTSLTTITIPLCTVMGDVDCTINEDNFISISGQTITLTLPASLMTCNNGNPDPDIDTLINNNTVTVITT